MTSRLIGLGLSDCPSSPVRAKVECCEPHDLLGCQVMDCSATRIPSSSITGHHPRPTGSLIGGGTPLQRCSQHILQPQLTRQWNMLSKLLSLVVVKSALSHVMSWDLVWNELSRTLRKETFYGHWDILSSVYGQVHTLESDWLLAQEWI